MTMPKKIRCLVTAGPTREYFDPVRYISNPSTGKMGWHIANASAARGWETTLVLGSSSLPDADCKTVRVVSAQDMLEACQSRFGDIDVLIMSAAVSDVRPKVVLTEKAKKADIDLRPELERTPDILKTLSGQKTSQILIGFAAETQNVLEYARGKLQQKNLDCVVANDVSREDAGFASDNNAITIVAKSGEVLEFAPASKKELATKIIDFIAKKFNL